MPIWLQQHERGEKIAFLPKKSSEAVCAQRRAAEGLASGVREEIGTDELLFTALRGFFWKD